MRTPTPPDFDASRFDSLTLHDARLQRDLLDAFLRQAPQLREQLVASGHADIRVFGETVHMLKGCCHFVAGERLLALVRRTEIDMASGGTPRALLPALLAGFDRLHARVARELARRVAVTDMVA